MHRWGPLVLASLVAALLTWRMAPPPPCISLAVTSSEEKSSLLVQLSGEFESSHPKVGDRCIEVTVTRKASGAAEQALAHGWNDATDGPRPDAWLPAAITWIYLLGYHHPNLAKPDSPSLFRSPLVIGMPKDMALKLGWPDKDIGWADLLKLASNQTGWSTYGRPEWGAFQLGKTNPNISTSGLHALIATYFAASGKTGDLTSATLADPAVRNFVMGVEKAVVHYGDSVSNFLLNLQAADDEGQALSYVSAVAMEEKQIWDYNQGNPKGDPKDLGKHAAPKVPLVAIYPKEGTLAADHPYAILDAPWVTPEKRQAAEAFLGFLEKPEIQGRFQDAGFRNQRGVAGPVIKEANGMLPDRPGAYLVLPNTGQVISDIQASWNELRKRARVLIVIDQSALSGDSGAKNLAQSVANGLKQLVDDDMVGAWAVPAAAGSTQPYSEIMPLQPLGPHRAELQSAIANIHRSSDRPALYRAVTLAVDQLKIGRDPTKLNAVVVISAGRSNPADTARFKTFADLSAVAGEIPGIHVFTVGYGAKPDQKELQLMSTAGKGAYYDASDPSSVARALISVISNF
jgi:Ca-activated chloride channel family protein